MAALDPVQALAARAVVEMIRLPRGLVLALGGSALALVVSLVQFFEGVRYDAYQDIGGVWTICYGHTGDVLPGQHASAAMCSAYLKADIDIALAAVERLITAPLPVTRKAGLADFVINGGSNLLAKSSIRRKLNAGDTAGGCAAISLYVYAAGHDCRVKGSGCEGIVTRRNVERWLCELEP